MRLVTVKIKGFKRFRDEATLDVDSEVTALVGPNEAGKTTVLQALTHTNHTEAFAGSERSRGLQAADEGFIQLRFLLEPEDREALRDIEGGHDVRWYTVEKLASGDISTSIEPYVQRDLSGRPKLATDLRRAAMHRSLQPLTLDPESGFDQSAVLALADELDGADSEELTDELIDDLRSIADVLEGQAPAKIPRYIRDLSQRAREQSQREEQKRPSELIRERLRTRCPKFLMFGESERTLENAYDLMQLPHPRPAALANLAQLAQMDLDALVSAVAEERLGEVEELVDHANRGLRDYFEANWEQTHLAVAFRVSGTELLLFVREESGTYWRLAERSDGLRWFVALVAYLHTRDFDTNPVLLIDEAEQHLHYDGQADLTRAFERQEVAADIIYTTHSAGCLPQDLGTGVRVVGRDEDTTSVIQNSLWSRAELREGAGFSALLMKMGASTFAFAATRRAVICEGKTDVVLLPTLLRQATGLDSLPYQLVPGLANVANNAVVELEMAAVRVAFLVDSDQGGDGIIRKLRRAGVPRERILRLSSGGHSRTLEDFVDPRSFQMAVGNLLARSGIDQSPPLSELRKKPRHRALEGWCARQRPRLDAPDKMTVARELLRAARHGELIVQPAATNALRTMHAQFERVLEPDSP